MSLTVGCLGKIAYATRALAEKAKSHLLRRPGYLNGGHTRCATLESYHCIRCGHYHLGRNKRAGGRDHKKTADHHAGSFKARKARYKELTE